LLISDLPLNNDGLKTKKSSESVFDAFMSDHIEKGVAILKAARKLQSQNVKGAYHRNL
jgi:AMP nucleosidase